MGLLRRVSFLPSLPPSLPPYNGWGWSLLLPPSAQSLPGRDEEGGNVGGEGGGEGGGGGGMTFLFVVEDLREGGEGGRGGRVERTRIRMKPSLSILPIPFISQPSFLPSLPPYLDSFFPSPSYHSPPSFPPSPPTLIHSSHPFHITALPPSLPPPLP